MVRNLREAQVLPALELRHPCYATHMGTRLRKIAIVQSKLPPTRTSLALQFPTDSEPQSHESEEKSSMLKRYERGR